MALSFADSVGQKQAKQTNSNVFSAAVMSAEVYAADQWTLDSRYKNLPEYSDTAMSIIDGDKNILVDQNQINLTRESNSQFIPFEMPRFYDGFDLFGAELTIYYVNKNNHDNYATPVNVYYSDDKIKFGWLIDKYVTAVEGVVRFEIHASGTNSHGDDYLWKSRPCDGINVLKSLSGDAPIDIGATWLTEFIADVTEQAELAKEYAEQAKAAAVHVVTSEASDITLVDFSGYQIGDIVLVVTTGE